MNITLIGMAGAGKSAVGRKIAEILDYQFIDIDRIIAVKDSPQKLIDQFGEKHWLAKEARTVLKLKNISNSIISPGGSIIYSPRAMKFLKNISKIIFLDANPFIIKQRININSRGIIGLKIKSFEEVYDERRPLYKKYADIIIESENKNIAEISREILNLIKYK
ncbi:MAG: shikimate kinase [Parcubacteria group bacterium]|nr:shikimate kinase [Parcubacteria group bacterium]